MSWEAELGQILRRRKVRGEQFTLHKDVYPLEKIFAKRYPNSRTVRDSLRLALQHLRDQGMIEFVNNNGLYRRIL